MIRFTLCLALMAGPAFALQCAPHADMLAGLAATYQEAPTGGGMTPDGKMMTVTASEKGTWTALLTGADGKACIVAFGTGYVRAAVKPNI